MKVTVVDASFAGAWLLPDENSERAEELLGRAVKNESSLVAPDLWTYEILNLLVAASRRGRLKPDQLDEALDLIGQLPLSFYDHETSLVRSRTAILALRFDLSAYDAAYLELADRLQAPLRSLDAALAQAAGKLGLD